MTAFSGFAAAMVAELTVAGPRSDRIPEATLAGMGAPVPWAGVHIEQHILPL